MNKVKINKLVKILMSQKLFLMSEMWQSDKKKFVFKFFQLQTLSKTFRKKFSAEQHIQP